MGMIDISLFIYGYVICLLILVILLKKDVNNLLNKFLAEYSVTSASILHIIQNENDFDVLRYYLYDQSTIRKHRRAKELVNTID